MNLHHKVFMKFIIFFLLASILCHATISSETKLYIVTQDVESGDYKLNQVSVIGCHSNKISIALEQFTKKYEVPSQLGCGYQSVVKENINALTCVQIKSYKATDNDFLSLESLTLDISKCADKQSSLFETIVRTAVKYNFAGNKSDLKLNLIY